LILIVCIRSEPAHPPTEPPRSTKTSAALAKWSAYYTAEDGCRPPWESGAPATYVTALVEKGALLGCAC
jgi:hypothetical protein